MFLFGLGRSNVVDAIIVVVGVIQLEGVLGFFFSLSLSAYRAIFPFTLILNV